MPLYFCVVHPECYLGRNIDVVTKRDGWFGSTFHQDVTLADRSVRIWMPYFLVKKIREASSQVPSGRIVRIYGYARKV